jgi:large subunit ribosomal protein L22
MISKAEAKYSRISPRKMDLVFDLIRGAKVSKALEILAFTNHKGAPMMVKVLKSAVSNAKNKGYSEDGLYIAKVVANAGPMMKRFRAASFGRAAAIRKRTAHLVVELESSEKIVTSVKVK